LPASKASKKRGKAAAIPLPGVVEEVREDGMLRHQEIVRAHTDAIMAIVMAEDCIYTASRDKLLKRWKPTRNAQGRFEMIPELEVKLGDVCWCLISAGEWLFCGLGDGSIKAFAKSGKEALLKGHTKRVACLLTHLHVLLSGGLEGAVRCWQVDPATQTFACTHSITEGIPGAVTSMCVLAAPAAAGAAEVTGLWIGGASGACIVDLATLKVGLQLPPKKFVAGLLKFEGHMIVVYADGGVCIFNAVGTLTHTQPPLPAGPVLCVAGLESGPRVLCGHAKGQVSSIMLPMFNLKQSWQALERCKVQILCSAGHDGIFMLGAENGNLQLWQRDSAVP